MRQLVEDEMLSSSNIHVITTALGFDFSKEIKIACKDKKLSYGERNEIVSPVERLWDYNRKTIGRDLGM